MTPATEFVQLDKSLHDRNGFDCGTDQLNEFLQRYALRHNKLGVSKTMVLADSNETAQICAIYTLSHTEIKRETLPEKLRKRLPKYPIPVLLIAQLAVHTRLQGQGFGGVTLIQALRHCLRIETHLPSNAIVVDSINSAAHNFYLHYGFEPLDNTERRLFIPVATAKKLFS